MLGRAQLGLRWVERSGGLEAASEPQGSARRNKRSQAPHAEGSGLPLLHQRLGIAHTIW